MDASTWVAIIGVGLLAVLLPVGLVMMKKRRALLVAQLQEKLGADRILVMDERAMFYGLRSRGSLQPRGTGGVWALTDEAIHYRSLEDRGATKLTLELPLSSIRSITEDTNFMSLGYQVIGGLLIVEYSTPEGEDAVAWKLRDKKRVRALIEERVPKRVRS